MVGLITPHEVRVADPARWGQLTVGELTRPLETIRTVDPRTPVEDALRAMARDDINQLPVMSDGRLEGIVSRGHILGLLQSRQGLKRAS